jgi:hypothetical protein
MRHLSQKQLVDVAEGNAGAERARHAAACDVCRGRVESLQAALRAAGEDRIPEPSPLFWTHFAARVGAAVRGGAAPETWWQAWGRRWAPAGAAALLVASVGLGALLWNGQPRDSTTRQGTGAAAVPPRAAVEPDAEPSATDDPSWTLMNELSADVAFDEAFAAGAIPGAGGTERALWQLSDEERGELAKILRAEMARPASADSMNPGV